MVKKFDRSYVRDIFSFKTLLTPRRCKFLVNPRIILLALLIRVGILFLKIQTFYNLEERYPKVLNNCIYSLPTVFLRDILYMRKISSHWNLQPDWQLQDLSEYTWLNEVTVRQFRLQH